MITQFLLKHRISSKRCLMNNLFMKNSYHLHGQNDYQYSGLRKIIVQYIAVQYNDKYIDDA